MTVRELQDALSAWPPDSQIRVCDPALNWGLAEIEEISREEDAHTLNWYVLLKVNFHSSG